MEKTVTGFGYGRTERHLANGVWTFLSARRSHAQRGQECPHAVRAESPLTMRRFSAQRGFTLLEMLVVIGILGMLMALAYTGLAQAMRQARIAKANAEIRQLIGAWFSYEAANDDWPTDMVISDGEAVDATENVLRNLLGGVGSTEEERRRVYLNVQLKDGPGGMAFRDPWGMPYRLKITPQKPPNIEEHFTAAVSFPNRNRPAIQR
ncbi:MAG: type II secretion system GspH family protein [Kiritimatiellaeota bacterium]|nr:type II secretion system GspH family protein [Kiritimatiellota bacterium]